jgi:hypothetical protein
MNIPLCGGLEHPERSAPSWSRPIFLPWLRAPRFRPSAWRSSRPAATAAARWRRAPTSICCSCCPTSRPPGARASREAILYCLWDLGLKVGHATRSVDECIRQAKADMTIRTAILEARFMLGDASAVRRTVARFDKEVVQGTGAEFVAAKLAERDERHAAPAQSRYLVEPNVKDGKGGLRDLHTLFWIAKYVYRVSRRDELVDSGVFDREEYGSSAAARIPVVGALPHAFRHRPRRGAAVVRHPARDRGAARLHRASRPEGRRALHEALLPDGQGRRRPDRDLLRGAGGAQAKPRRCSTGSWPASPARPRRSCARSTTSSSTTTASTSPTGRCSKAIRST